MNTWAVNGGSFIAMIAEPLKHVGDSAASLIALHVHLNSSNIIWYTYTTDFLGIYIYSIYIYIWWCPKIGLSPHHPSIENQLWGTIYGTCSQPVLRRCRPFPSRGSASTCPCIPRRAPRCWGISSSCSVAGWVLMAGVQGVLSGCCPLFILNRIHIHIYI